MPRTYQKKFSRLIKPDKEHLYRYKKELFDPEVDRKYDELARASGWASGEVKVQAMKVNFIRYCEGKDPKYKGD